MYTFHKNHFANSYCVIDIVNTHFGTRMLRLSATGTPDVIQATVNAVIEKSRLTNDQKSELKTALKLPPPPSTAITTKEEFKELFKGRFI